MKKDKEWIYKEVDKLRIYTNPDIPTRLDDLYGQYVSGVNSAVEEVLGLINQLDEPEGLSQELPVIPKYVAEYINLVKIDIPLMKILEVANRRNELPEWKKEYDWISSNDEMFTRAWLDGYEVEEEPLYYALIKGHELVNDEVEWATKYWNLWVSEGCVFPYDKSETTDDFSIIMSKEDWNKYGINDLNADFIKVKKEEE